MVTFVSFISIITWRNEIKKKIEMNPWVPLKFNPVQNIVPTTT